MNKQETPKALCWDLDDTLGTFYRYAYELEDKPVPDWERPTSLRYGIKDLLHDFSEEAGYIHFVTTSATLKYANLALEKSGLTHFFKDVFGRGTVFIDWGKHYKPVAETLGFSEDAMRANMIAIGDAPGDQPIDIDIVFIDLGSGNVKMDALVIREILTTILEKGDGHFKKGFERLFSEAKPRFPDEKPEFQHKTYNLGNGITFELEYRGERGTYIGKKVVPTITSINAPEYERDPDLL